MNVYLRIHGQGGHDWLHQYFSGYLLLNRNRKRRIKLLFSWLGVLQVCSVVQSTNVYLWVSLNFCSVLRQIAGIPFFSIPVYFILPYGLC